MAWLIGTMTEELAKHTGETIGGLINATFGNIVEMLLCVSGTGVRFCNLVSQNGGLM